MGSANFNMEDPKVQEDIRRQHHEYIPTAGKHGAYVKKQYNREKNEYPKMMAKHPQPQFKAFQGKPNAQELYELALREWDAAMSASIVNSKAEEQAWLKENG